MSYETRNKKRVRPPANEARRKAQGASSILPRPRPPALSEVLQTLDSAPSINRFFD